MARLIDADLARPVPTLLPPPRPQPTQLLAVVRVRPVHVAKVTAFVAGVVSAALWCATFVLWLIANPTGVVGGVERFLQDLGFTDFRFMSSAVIASLLLASVMWVALTTATATLCCLAYNWYAERVHPIDVDVVDGAGIGRNDGTAEV